MHTMHTAIHFAITAEVILYMFVLPYTLDVQPCRALVYTSLPIILFGVYDMDVLPETCLRYPWLYRTGEMFLILIISSNVITNVSALSVCS